MDLALNNLQRLIYHKTQQTKQTKPVTVETLSKIINKYMLLYILKITII